MATEGPTIEQQWNEAHSRDPRIVQIPTTRDTLCQWVTNVASSIGGIASTTDQLGEDSFSNEYVLSRDFGILEGGTLMNALGDNNDCLIHSFLSCLCPSFRKYNEQNRTTIASFFRRFIMIRLDGVDVEKLKSREFLDTNDLTLLCIHFHTQFLIVKRGVYAVDRDLEFIPTLADVIYNWRPLNNTNRGPFYVIHGSGVHFTPVAWNGNYELRDKTFVQLNDLTLTIGRAREADRPIDLIRKRDTELEIRKLLGEYDLDDIKQQIENSPTKAGKYNILSRSVLQLRRGLADRIGALDSTRYSRDYAGFILFTSIVNALTGEDSSASSATSNATTTQSSNSATTQSSTFESDLKTAIEASIRTERESEERKKAENNAQMSAATAASLTPNEHNQDLQTALKLSTLDVMLGVQKLFNESTQEIQPHVQHTTLSINTGVHRKKAVLSMLSGITATVDENSGKYTATVYEPVKSGGKRNTKKAIRVKKQKTKKLKRSK